MNDSISESILSSTQGRKQYGGILENRRKVLSSQYLWAPVGYKREQIKSRRKCVERAYKIIYNIYIIYIIYFMVTVRFNRLWGNGSEMEKFLKKI